MVLMSATLNLNQVSTAQAAILGRTILTMRDDLPPDRARLLVDLHFAQEDVARMNELASKARSGELTPDEVAELDDYRRAGHVLETLKSKARRRLREAGENS
jgi:hypothetical protein